MVERFLHGVALFCRRRYRLVFLVAGALAAICLLLTLRLEFESDMLAVLPRNEPRVDTFRETLEDFGGLDLLLVVVALDVPEMEIVSADTISELAKALSNGKTTALYLGGRALREESLAAAGRIAKATNLFADADASGQENPSDFALEIMKALAKSSIRRIPIPKSDYVMMSIGGNKFRVLGLDPNLSERNFRITEVPEGYTSKILMRDQYGVVIGFSPSEPPISKFRLELESEEKESSTR